MTRKPSFTLIELLIVVAIIGILAAIAVPNFLNAQMRAKASRATADLRSIRTAIEMYTTDHGRAIMDPIEFQKLGGSLDVIEGWQQLTTPISYISASAFKDPFVPKENPGGAAGFYASAQGVYSFRNIKWMRQVNDQGAAFHGDPTACWVARSPGPDQIYIPRPEKLAYWMAYMPSNGLRSFGDIMVADKGILGVNFPGQNLPMPTSSTGY
ncbi:MAG: prepilin-type N-terminal cleavage/methylation domain-containing protein [bacterium]